MVLVNELVAAQTSIADDGSWQVRLPRLAPGNHDLKTFSETSDGTKSTTSQSVPILIVDSAPFDFTRTGKSSITTWTRSGGTVRFKTRQPNQNSWTTQSVAGRYPAPGDYDDDGITDIAAVGVQGRSLIWTIRPSSTGNAVQIRLGKDGDKILTGCRLLDPTRYSLVTFREGDRLFSIQHLGDSKVRTFTVKGVTRGDILGCGDSDGDGIDEVLFRVPGANSKEDRLVSCSVTAKKGSAKSLARFEKGELVSRVGSDAPLLAIIGPASRRGAPIRIETIAGTFAFPIFWVTGRVSVSSGVFGNSATEQIPGLVWTNEKHRKLYLRILRRDAPTRALFRMPRGYQLAKPRAIIETRGR